jgi:hypothetical protein
VGPGRGSRRKGEGAGDQPPSPTASNFVVAWDNAVATGDGRAAIAAKLAKVGRSGLIELMPADLLADFTDAIVGLEITKAAASSNLTVGLTRILRLALASEKAATNAIGRLKAKLAANNRSPNDLIVRFAPAKPNKGRRKG